ncbi:MAG: hypothetical protein JW787_07240 [Sedimentisphaerales bacterium]|nr:hypothetical protein [Sedimentisphaerales bacterium]
MTIAYCQYTGSGRSGSDRTLLIFFSDIQIGTSGWYEERLEAFLKLLTKEKSSIL